MKMLMIVCETGIDYRVVKVLDEAHVPGYTRYSGVSGVGETGRRLGSPIMPGQNTVFLSVMSDELAQQVTEKLKELVDSFEERRKPALRVFAMPAEILL